MNSFTEEAYKTTKTFLTAHALNAVAKDGKVYKLWTCMGCHEHLFLTELVRGTNETRKCNCGATTRLSLYKNGKVVRRRVK